MPGIKSLLSQLLKVFLVADMVQAANYIKGMVVALNWLTVQGFITPAKKAKVGIMPRFCFQKGTSRYCFQIRNLNLMKLQTK